MKYLSPEIEQLAKSQSNKSLAKPGVSCGIFQDCFDTKLEYNNLPRKKNTTVNV